MNNVTEIFPGADSDDGPWLQIIAPKVYGVRAFVVADVEPDISWSIEFSLTQDLPEGSRFMMSTVTVGTAEGMAIVDVGAVLLGDDFGTIDESRYDEFAELVADAGSLDVVYDFALIAARSLLATIGNGSIPDPALIPEPVIRPMLDGDD